MENEFYDDFAAFDDAPVAVAPTPKRKTTKKRAVKSTAKKRSTKSRTTKDKSSPKVALLKDLQKSKIDRAQYADDPALNWSTLRKFVADPRTFGRFPDDRSAAKDFGTLFHAALLEPERFAEKARTFDPPRNPKTGEPFGATTKTFQEAFDAWRAELPDDALVVSQKDAETIAQMQAAFQETAPFVDGWRARPFETELPLKTLDAVSGIEIKGRLDLFSDALGIVDVKTTNAPIVGWDGSDAFYWTARRFGYLFELAYYAKIVREITGVSPPVSMLVFETTKPYRVGVYKVRPATVVESIRRIDEEFIPLWIERPNFKPIQFEY